MANTSPKDDASQYESGEEWEIGLGNLIIDLDADLEKETMSTDNSLNDSSPFRIGKMKIKRKVSNAKADGVNDDAVEDALQTITEDKSTKSRKRDIVNNKNEKTTSSTSLCENNIEDDKPKSKGGNKDNDVESKVVETTKNEGRKKTKETSEKKPRKCKVDKQPSFEHIGIGTSEVGTLTEPDKLGPCEPGTSVNLEGIVWHETDEGVLVVNVTWRNKTYVGTLMDCTKHDWAPPRFCESPVNDVEGKAQLSKGRPKRNRNSTSVTDLSNYTETRSSIHCKLRNSSNGKGRRANIPIATVSKSDTILNGKRKAKTSESDLNSGDDKVAKKIKNSKTHSPVRSSESASIPYTISNGLIECPEPNCSKKYKHINGLRYHQAHAHHELPKKPQEPLDTSDPEDDFNDFTDIDTKELETVDTNPADTQSDTENAEVTSVNATDAFKEIDAAVDSDDVVKDTIGDHLPKMVVDNEDEILDRKQEIPETNSECNASENIQVKNSDTELPVDDDSQETLSKCKHPDKDLSVYDFNSTAESDKKIVEGDCSDKTPVSVIKATVEANTAEKEINQPDIIKTEPNNITSPAKPPVAVGDQQKLKRVEKDKVKLQEKQKKTKPEKLLIKPKPNRPIAPAPQITQQLIAFPAVVAAPANAAAAMPPVTTKAPVSIMPSSTLKPIQPKPTVMSDQVVNPVLGNLKDKKQKSKKRLKEKEVERKPSSPSIKDPERKSLVGKTEVPIRPTGASIAHLKASGLNLSELEPNILKQALTQSGINLDDYNSSSPSGSESNECKDGSKDLPRTKPPDTAAPSSTVAIPEPPKLIRTSSLPVKAVPTQPKPLQQFEKNMAEKPVMSVLPAVKGTTVRPQDDLPPRVVIPPPLSASPDQSRATQSPAYSDISDANEEDPPARDGIVDVKDPFVFQEMGPMTSHGHGRDGVLTEQRSFFPGYSGVIVRDRSRSPLGDAPPRPEMPKLIPKQRSEREIDVEESSSDSKNKEESTSPKPSIYQHPQLYTPHRYPPFYLGYPHHMDPAASPLHMLANPPYARPHERMEKDQRDKDVAKNIDSKGQRNATHSRIESSRIENANVESIKSSKTEMNRTDKKVKSERTTEERDKQAESHRRVSDGVELKPQIRIRSPQESPRHYDRLLPQSYYMYPPHPQWEESRRREIDERRKPVKSKPDERKHHGQSSRSEQSPNPRVREEGKHRHTPESTSSSTSMDSKTMRGNLPQDKPHKMEGSYSQYLQPSYMLPYSVVDDPYRQSVVAYQQYLPPEFGYPSVWKPDETGGPSNDPKRAKLMPGHSSTSPGKLTEILPDGKNALEVLKQHANQLMYPQNKEHIRGQDANRTSPRKSASPAARKTPESSNIEEISRFDGSRHSPRPQMQHLHMHHHTHLGYPMMPYGQIITGNHSQAASNTLNPYTNTRE